MVPSDKKFDIKTAVTTSNSFFVEASSGFEPLYKVLQTSA